MSLKQGMTTHYSCLGYDVAVSFRRFKKGIAKKFPIDIQKVNKLRKKRVKLLTADIIQKEYIRGFTKIKGREGKVWYDFNHEPIYWFKEYGFHFVMSSMPEDYRMNLKYQSPNTIL